LLLLLLLLLPPLLRGALLLKQHWLPRMLSLAARVVRLPMPRRRSCGLRQVPACGAVGAVDDAGDRYRRFQQ
jgi:hypothetical protein